MPRYRVKVTYKYSDFVYVTAENEEEALAKAPDNTEEKFECLYDCEIINVNYLVNEND